MLEVAYKIVAQILLARLKVIEESKEHLDHENQCGLDHSVPKKCSQRHIK